MTGNKSLRGSLVALVTPMKSSGAVDWAALDGLVDWHLEVRNPRHRAGGDDRGVRDA